MGRAGQPIADSELVAKLAAKMRARLAEQRIRRLSEQRGAADPPDDRSTGDGLALAEIPTLALTLSSRLGVTGAFIDLHDATPALTYRELQARITSRPGMCTRLPKQAGVVNLYREVVAMRRVRIPGPPGRARRTVPRRRGAGRPRVRRTCRATRAGPDSGLADPPPRRAARPAPPRAGVR